MCPSQMVVNDWCKIVTLFSFCVNTGLGSYPSWVYFTHECIVINLNKIMVSTCAIQDLKQSTMTYALTRSLLDVFP
jgi:hypothetical protein